MTATTTTTSTTRTTTSDDGDGENDEDDDEYGCDEGALSRTEASPRTNVSARSKLKYSRLL